MRTSPQRTAGRGKSQRNLSGQRRLHGVFWGVCASVLLLSAEVHAQVSPPNIIVVMGDDIGWANIGSTIKE